MPAPDPLAIGATIVMGPMTMPGAIAAPDAEA
jgi:hypothetical protein